MNTYTKLIALLAALFLVAACGDGDNGADGNDSDHPHYDKCATSCAADEDCADDEQQCLETCLARTEDLEGTCATCVSEDFAVDLVCTSTENQSDGASGSSESADEGGSCSCDLTEGTVSGCESHCD